MTKSETVTCDVTSTFLSTHLVQVRLRWQERSRKQVSSSCSPVKERQSSSVACLSSRNNQESRFHNCGGLEKLVNVPGKIEKAHCGSLVQVCL